MAAVDIAILCVVGVSALVGALRGFLREVLSLAAWVAAFWVAWATSDDVAPIFATLVTAPTGQLILAFVVVFVGTLLGVGIVNWLIFKLADKTGLSGTDRLLGVAFGFGRGAALVLAAVLVAGLLPVRERPWWQASLLLPPLDTLAHALAGRLEVPGAPVAPEGTAAAGEPPAATVVTGE